MEPKPTIAIIGCGYVGLTTAAILSNCGYQVLALEVNPERLAVIKQGKSFFYEAGIDALLKQGLDTGNLTVGNAINDSITAADIVFSCVGTPDNPDGSSNLQYVFGAAEQAANFLHEGTIFVQKSTVPVGTGERIKASFVATNKNIAYVSNPEFLREGTAVADTLWFDRIVVGSQDKAAGQAVIELYKAIEANRAAVAATAGLQAPLQIPEARYLEMSRNSAELTKVTANAFLALKISFTNSIAKLADNANADITEVMEAVGADNRIGRAFLNAGRGYGGGCFPKDVSGLISSAAEHNLSLPIMTAAIEVNNSMPDYIVQKTQSAIGGPLADQKIAMLGLSFKANTSDTRRSPAIALANAFVKAGARLQAYDPVATTEAKEQLDPAIVLAYSLEQAIEGATCICIGTDWQEFIDFKWPAVTATLVVDCMNCLDPQLFKNSTTKYIGVGH